MLPARTISRRRVALVLTLILTGLASGLASDRSEAVGLPPARSVVFGPRPLWAAMVLQASGINPPTATGAEMGAVMNWATARVVKQMVVVPRHTERVPDPGMDKGMTRLVQAGRDGRIERVYLVMRDAAGDASQTLISQRVMTKAQPQVIAVGTREPLRVLLTSRGTYTYRRALTMIATAYEPSERSCGKYADGYTAIGMKAVPGVVAVDPKVIPLRTRLYVEGYGPAIAADVGAAIKGNRIDLFFETVEEALAYGRRRVKVYILEDH